MPSHNIFEVIGVDVLVKVYLSTRDVCDTTAIQFLSQLTRVALEKWYSGSCDERMRARWTEGSKGGKEVWKDCSKVAQSSSTATPDDLHQRKSIPLKFLACSLEEGDVCEEGV
jgi:hypothetical protein